MRSFLARYASEIKGTLSGWDRVRLRGTLRLISSLRGLGAFLASRRLLLKDFKAWSLGLTDAVRQETERIAAAAQRPMIYLDNSHVRKEELAQNIAQRDRISEGLICVLRCVEPCYTFKVGPNRARQRWELRQQAAKCLHYYFYLQHPACGFLHVRLQTWLPFTVHVCLNGREILENQLRRERLGYVRRDNCFVDLTNPVRAQQLFDRQLQTDWPALARELLQNVHPTHPALFAEARPPEYYWSADETEWATDVMFRSPQALARIYPGLLQHAMTHLSSRDVLRFFGRPAAQQHYRAAQLQTNLSRRHEGVRCKHQLNRNSIKVYDKQETVLRVETTINDARDLKVLHPRESAPNGPPQWRPLRKGVTDLPRRAEVSQAANQRYLEALAAVEVQEPLAETVKTLCEPLIWEGRRVRGLAPFTPLDASLLAAVLHGEFALQGFRNRDLRALLFAEVPVDQREHTRPSAKVTRLIRLLRAHELAHKIPHTHRYQLTSHGRTAITALLAAQRASTQKPAQLAA